MKFRPRIIWLIIAFIAVLWLLSSLLFEPQKDLDSGSNRISYLEKIDNLNLQIFDENKLLSGRIEAKKYLRFDNKTPVLKNLQLITFDKKGKINYRLKAQQADFLSKQKFRFSGKAKLTSTAKNRPKLTSDEFLYNAKTSKLTSKKPIIYRDKASKITAKKLEMLTKKHKIKLFGSVKVTKFASKKTKHPVYIKADKAVIDDKKGVSVFSKNAKIKHYNLQISASNITTFSEQKKLHKIIAIGKKGLKPKKVNYQQGKKNSKKFVKAIAYKIIYDAKNQLVYLYDKVRLRRGNDFFSGEIVIYNIKKDRVRIKKSQKPGEQVKFKIKL